MSKGFQDCAFSVSMIVIGAWLWWEAIQPRYQTSAAQDYGFSPTFLPRILIGMWIVISLILLIRSFGLWSRRVSGSEWKTLGLFVALVFAYVGLMTQIGFLFSSIPFAICAMWFMGFRRALPVALIATAFPLAVWYGFVFILKIPLPYSPWFSQI